MEFNLNNIMRLVEFINTDLSQLQPGQEIDSTEETQIAELAVFIQTNCGNYLRAMQSAGSLIYRGIQTAAGTSFNEKLAFLGHSRTNRKNLSGFDDEVHQMFAKWLSDHKFLATRTNCIYATSDNWTANAYGNRLYAIFPLNSASFTWSRNFTDLIDDWHELNDTNTIKVLSGEQSNPMDNLTQDQIDKFMAIGKWDNQDFVSAIKSEHEILISGAYVAITVGENTEPGNLYDQLATNLLDPDYKPKIKKILPKVNANILAHIQKDPYSIQYFPDASETEKLAAVRADGSSIQYITSPSVAVQLAAVKNDYTALSYIANPDPQVVAAATSQNSQAGYYAT